MSHELEINPHTGVASGVFGHDKSAWHTLGHNVSGAINAEEGMKIAGLAGWNVRKEPLYTLKELPDGSTEATQFDGKYATVRDNPFTPGQEDHLGVVGEIYEPFQNEDGAEFLNMLAGEGVGFDTMGSIREGRQVFFSMKLPEWLLVGGVDRVDLNLTLLTSHDGSTDVTPMVTAIRTVCANTYDWALRSHISIASFRHTKGAKGRVQEVRETLGLTFSAKDAFAEEAERMIQEAMTRRQFEKTMFSPTGVYSTIAPKVTAGDRAKENWKATKDGLMDYFLGDIEGADSKIGKTAWGAFQAVTWMEDHQRNIRSGETTLEGRKRDRAERAVSGIGANLKNKAWAALRVPVKSPVVLV